MKKSFVDAKMQLPADFKRDTGVSPENFDQILKLVKTYLNDLYETNPNKAKGVKPSILLEDRGLLTFYYLRHYVTFKCLGDNFGISESYANKIFHFILNILVNKLHVKGSQELLDADLDTIVVDVAEQQIERPVANQKQYYSGKKKAYN